MVQVLQSSYQDQFRVTLPPMPSVAFLFTLICLLNAMDVVMSLGLVTSALKELSPVISALMCRYGTLPAFLGPKLVSLTLLAVGVFSMPRHSLFARRMLVFIATAYGFLVSYLIGLTIAYA
jgi:hypothetical protein